MPAVLQDGAPARPGWRPGTASDRRFRPAREVPVPRARNPVAPPSRTRKPPLMRADAGLLAIIICLCVVVVEVTVRSRPRRAVGSARSTRRSSIACARSSRTPLPPALVGAGRSVPRPAAVPAVMSHASRLPRPAIRALRRVTLKRPRKHAALRSSGPPRKLHLTPAVTPLRERCQASLSGRTAMPLSARKRLTSPTV